MITIINSTIAATVAKPVVNQSVFDALPDSAMIRLNQLVTSPKRPQIPAPLPFTSTTLWRKVRNGTFPSPIRLSERITAWHVGTVRAWMTAQAAQNYAPACAVQIAKTNALAAV